MKQILILDSNYSTTKLCYKFLSDNYLDENGRIKEDLKFSITIPELNVINSKIPKEENEKIDTYIFLPKGENRKGEGGLRTKGYLKFSYKYKNGKWWAIDFRGNKLFNVNLPKKILENVEKENIKELPLVTIVTVVLNNKEGLEKTIKSVINQTYPNIEYIVIDGGSTDGTLDIIKKYENYIDYWVSEEDKGIYDAMNKGISLASGCFIYFIGAGDQFIGNINLQKLVFNIIKNVKLKNDKYLPVFAFPVQVFGKKSLSFPKIKNDIPMVHHQGVIFHTIVLKKEKLYSLKYKIHSDYDLILYLVKRFGIEEIEIPLCLFYRGGISTNGLNALRSIRELTNIYKIYGGKLFSKTYFIMILRPIYYLLSSYFNRILK